MYFPKSQFQLGSPLILVTAPEMTGSFTPTLGKYMEWTAVDTLVELTKGNVDALHSTMFPAQIGM